MIEDKLTREERIRLEALAQATASSGVTTPSSAEQIIEKAARFEIYIRGDDNIA